MKELSIEEKAKRYDEAIEIAKSNYDTIVGMDENCTFARSGIINTFHHMFPELKESEDKGIIHWIRKELEAKYVTDNIVNNVMADKALAWLEKQGKETSWKPSKEEMDVLYGLAYITNQYDEHKEEVITRLYQDLKREFFNGSSYENMFPNTEDGVRRRSTIQVLEYARSLDSYNQYGKEDIDKDIAWLEKQGEQNPTDKAEPKFHVGDWIICCGYAQTQIIDITTNMYKMSNGDIRPFNMVDNNHSIRLWTIQDAKDGNVLSNGKMIVIFKHFEDPSYRQHIVAYVGLDTNGDIQITDNTWNLGIDKAKPATKEQRDLLFSKMKEAGYEWDAEKKELSKIEDKPVAIIPKFKVGDIIRHKKQGFTCKIIAVDTEYRLSECNGSHLPFEFQDSYELVEQNPAWSEEDENRFRNLIYLVEHNEKSKGTKQGFIEFINRLKSLKERYTWKPSDEQIEALESATENCAYSEYQDCLRELIGQLKKLSGE